jgi:hypothetical protein
MSKELEHLKKLRAILDRRIDDIEKDRSCFSKQEHSWAEGVCNDRFAREFKRLGVPFVDSYRYARMAYECLLDAGTFAVVKVELNLLPRGGAK